MNEMLQIDDLTVAVRRSSRRKHVDLTVERDGGVTVSVPAAMELPNVERLVRQRLVTLHSVLSRKREVLSDRPAKEYVTGEGYLVLHELCHLHEHDHSEAFYARLRRASPDYCAHDAWLRAHGDDYRL